MWARSYAQYIAVKSKNATMLEELKVYQTSNEILTQWEDNDFVEIVRAIDELYKVLGWLK